MAKKKRRYTRRRTKKRRPRKKKIPLAPVFGLVAGLAEPVGNIIADPSAESIKGSLNHLGVIYTGYNAIEGRWQLGMLAKGLGPLVGGILVHKIAGALGVNRVFSNLPSPLNKLSI